MQLKNDYRINMVMPKKFAQIALVESKKMPGCPRQKRGSIAHFFKTLAVRYFNENNIAL